MFTGLVRNIGEITAVRGDLLEISCDFFSEFNDKIDIESNNFFSEFVNTKPIKIGDSIAVNGACLTAISVNSKSFCVQMSEESRKCVANELYKLGAKVHLERALCVSERLDGHIISGHIDGVGEILQISHSKIGVDFYIKIPQNIAQCSVPKGSVAVNGISLTINEILDFKNFSNIKLNSPKSNYTSPQNGAILRLSIIPHTFKNTLFSSAKVGERVNLESDFFGKMVFTFLSRGNFIAMQNGNKISNEENIKRELSAFLASF